MDDSNLDLSDTMLGNITVSDAGTSFSGSSYTITLNPTYTTSSTTLASGIYNTGVITGSSISNNISITDILSGWDHKPFEDSFPDWDDFQKMCAEYPGLQTAYEHLKVFYKLTIDDWESKKKGEDNV